MSTTWLTLSYIDEDGQVCRVGAPRKAHIELVGLERVKVTAAFMAPARRLDDVQMFLGILDDPAADPLRVRPLDKRLSTWAGDTINASFDLVVTTVEGVPTEGLTEGRA